MADVNNCSEFKPGIGLSTRLMDKNGRAMRGIAKSVDLIKILHGFRTKLQSAMMGVFIAGGFYETQWTKMMKSILRYGMKIAK